MEMYKTAVMGICFLILTALGQQAVSLPSVYPTGVTIYSPEECANGYLLAFYQGQWRYPMVMDMNGNIVHLWKNVQGYDRMQLLQNGNLVLMYSWDKVDPPDDTFQGRNRLIEVDWDGNLVWELDFPVGPHHDFQRLENGNTLFICNEFIPEKYKARIENPQRRKLKIKGDRVCEVNRQGEIVWEWRACEHLDVNHYSPVDELNDWTHFNSVQSIPSNRWYEQGDQRFKPGNILICVRNLNTIYLIDKETKAIVWSLPGRLQWRIGASTRSAIDRTGSAGRGEYFSI